MFTLAQMLELTGLIAPSNNERAAILGWVLPMLAAHPRIASRSLEWHYVRLSRAIELGQIKLYFDRFGRNCGYLWWTRASAELESRLLRCGSEAMEASEMSTEGDAFMLDFRASLGELPNILVDLCDVLSPQCGTLTYFRYKRGWRIAKRITLDSKASFGHRASPVVGADEVAWLRSDKGKSSLFAAKAALEMSIASGLIITMFAQVDRYAKMQLPIVLGRMHYALKTRQFKLLRALDDEPLGYYSWAWREANAFSQIKPVHEWEPHEWRDGRDALVCDAIAMRSGADILRQELATFAEGDWWRYSESGPDGTRRCIHSHEWMSRSVPEADIRDFTALAVLPIGKLACEI